MKLYEIIGLIEGEQMGPGTIKKMIYAENEQQAVKKYYSKLEMRRVKINNINEIKEELIK